MPDRRKPTKTDKRVVRATDVLVGYGSTTDSAVCPPITVGVPAGGSLAVVGANGTGKSTFLRAVAGLLEVLAGRIEVFGKEVDEREARFRADVATVLDDDSYLPALTVREHLLLTARGHGMTGVSELVTDVIATFGLQAREHALPTALSSGQRRRLLLASAFVRPRQLLVLDEPEQRLDAGMRDRLAERLVQERRRGGTVVMATHDPVLVRDAATRVLVLTEDSVEVVDPERGAHAIEAL